jgi:quinol monooxygenase YgiN
MTYLTLLAKISAKADCETKLFPELEAMVKPSQNEPGCLKYVLHRLPGDSKTFWFVEEWKSEAALAEHNQTPHYLRMKERTAELVDNVELIRLEPVS